MSDRRSAVITDTARGIGQGMARAPARAGFDFLLAGFGDPAGVDGGWTAR